MGVKVVAVARCHQYLAQKAIGSVVSVSRAMLRELGRRGKEGRGGGGGHVCGYQLRLCCVRFRE